MMTTIYPGSIASVPKYVASPREGPGLKVVVRVELGQEPLRRAEN